MTHYAHAVSPWGNFAVSAATADDRHGTTARYLLTPIGSLPTVPTVTRFDGLPALDNDVLEAEGLRQLAERGLEPTPYTRARPQYLINRVWYAAEPMVTMREGGSVWVHTPYALGASLTESASSKFAQWWTDNHDSIITPAFLAATEFDRARNDEIWAERHAADAQRVLDEREAELAAARDRVTAASAALDAIEADA